MFCSCGLGKQALWCCLTMPNEVRSEQQIFYTPTPEPWVGLDDMYAGNFATRWALSVCVARDSRDATGSLSTLLLPPPPPPHTLSSLLISDRIFSPMVSAFRSGPVKLLRVDKLTCNYLPHPTLGFSSLILRIPPFSLPLPFCFC